MEDLLRATAERAARYLAGLQDRAVAPTPEALANLRRLDEPLPERPTDPSTVIRLLDEIGSPATMASAGGRFFGFVVGGSLPAAGGAGSPAPPGGPEARGRRLLAPPPPPEPKGTVRRAPAPERPPHAA